MSTIYSKFRNITTLLFDVDGVFTNSNILITESGDLLRSMSTQDGLAVKRAIKHNFNVAIITKGSSKGVTSRLEGLNVLDIYSAVDDKEKTFYNYITEKNTSPDQCLYMGDDLSDICVLKLVNIASCPSDAVHEVKSECNYISPYKGGEGCVRDVIERTLRSHGKWS